MLVLTEADVVRLLSPAEARAAVEGAFLRLARGEVESPPRVRLPLPDGQFAVMPCVDRGLGYAGLKTYAWTSEHAPFVVVLFTLAGELVAVLEAAALGELRTAAASAVAARQLARPGASSLGVLGCGRQGAAHVAALRDALPGLERVVAYCRTAKHLADFCAAHDCVAAAAASDAASCDVVVVATTSTQPVLRGEWLVPGAFVCAVGANDPAARELDGEVLRRADLVCVDSVTQAREEAGDLLQPARSGELDWARVHELQQILTGEVPGRARDTDIALFKSSGLPAWDLAAAARVVELAR